MNKIDINVQSERNWQSKLHFTFDESCMPKIIPALGVTKNEIATKIMHSRNSERAVKVMNGASTDMKDMLSLCARYNIDLAQLLLLPNGKHPVIITEEEYDRLLKMSHSSADDNNREVSESQCEELLPRSVDTAIEVPKKHIDNNSATSIFNNTHESTTKIYSLYERIIELTAENARMKALLSCYESKE